MPEIVVQLGSKSCEVILQPSYVLLNEMRERIADRLAASILAAVTFGPCSQQFAGSRTNGLGHLLGGSGNLTFAQRAHLV
ncbi:MAG: hypothetical protein WBY38_12650, partial [Candidatus Acidiferrales bacterium]